MNYCPSIDMEEILDAIGEILEVHVDGHITTTASMPVEGNNNLSGAPKEKLS